MCKTGKSEGNGCQDFWEEYGVNDVETVLLKVSSMRWKKRSADITVRPGVIANRDGVWDGQSEHQSHGVKIANFFRHLSKLEKYLTHDFKKIWEKLSFWKSFCQVAELINFCLNLSNNYTASSPPIIHA